MFVPDDSGDDVAHSVVHAFVVQKFVEDVGRPHEKARGSCEQAEHDEAGFYGVGDQWILENRSGLAPGFLDEGSIVVMLNHLSLFQDNVLDQIHAFPFVASANVSQNLQRFVVLVVREQKLRRFREEE